MGARAALSIIHFRKVHPCPAAGTPDAAAILRHQNRREHRKSFQLSQLR
jgi:hypothetical protein